MAAGALGTAANVSYLDRNGDLVRNPGEDLLVAGRNGAADVPVRFYQPGVDGFLHSGRWPAAVGPGQAPPPTRWALPLRCIRTTRTDSSWLGSGRSILLR